jgi:AcrR family transcriptional regulator
MARKVDLPSIEQIERAKASMLAHAHETGQRATVTALAKLLNLSNTTFWRYFPDIAREIAAHGRALSERTEPLDFRSFGGGSMVGVTRVPAWGWVISG